MIEINLIPDVKRELIRARRARVYVITGAVFTGLVSVGIVVIMALWLGGQSLQSSNLDGQISDKSKTLLSKPGLSHMLTIQHQLTKISEYHNEKNIYSRFFDLLAKVNPKAPNNITFSLVRVDSDSGTVHLEGQAANGYVAADVLKKTILKTSLSYANDDGKSVQEVPLTSDVVLSDLSYGEDSSGKLVLRFTMTFNYDPAIFAKTSSDAIIVGPNKQNATDSYLGLPENMFGDRATDKGGVTNG